MATEQQSRSFGQAAGAYSATRPSYPRDAVEWLVGDAREVVDLGAGTGKLTAVLRDVGATVTAVDPDDGMLAELRRTLPGVPTLVGTAEAIPVPDGSADAVVLGQAWHWVDVPVASAEVARVLRPGGVLGPIWNVRDQSVPWVAAYGDAMHGSEAEQLIADGGPSVGAPFAGFEERRWAWSRTATPDELVQLAASRSYLIVKPPAERAAALDRIRELLATHPDTRGRSALELPYVTHAFRARRP